jgi:hypothetical protein
MRNIFNQLFFICNFLFIVVDDDTIREDFFNCPTVLLPFFFYIDFIVLLNIFSLLLFTGFNTFSEDYFNFIEHYFILAIFSD